MLSKVYGAVIFSLDAYLIEIEIEHKNGMPCFEIVGLPDAAIKESRERIFEAIRNSGIELFFKKILCNLAPADLKKNGTFLDLPIALGLLASSGLIDSQKLKNTLIFGELGFDGAVKPVKGALALAILAKEKQISQIILPFDNLKEVEIIAGIEYFPVKNLKEALDFFYGKSTPVLPQSYSLEETTYEYDFDEVKGQALAKRAIEVATAGFHNILLIGSPGVGKTMLAKRIPTILPHLSLEESIEVSRIYSIAGQKEIQKGLITKRPFRSPHHSASDTAIIGGGSIPRPGEISLAHYGVLFLDELPEFKKSVLEVLREPLEERKITIARSEKVQSFPAHFLLVAALNPCPCGFLFHPTKQCRCSVASIKNYFNRISGPILDRIDIQIQVNEVQYKEIEKKEESSAVIRERIKNAIAIQKERLGKNRYNSDMTNQEIEKFCVLDSSSKKILSDAIDKFGFSMRAYTRILKTARTIADLEKSEKIEEVHIFEAFQYRSLEKTLQKYGIK